MNRKLLVIILAMALIVGGLYYMTTVSAPSEEPMDSTGNNEVPAENEGNDGVEGSGNGEGDSADQGNEVAVGKTAPNFTLTNLEGEEVSLEDYRGKYVLINFWATWCKFCDEEMPDLQKLYDANKDKDLVVLAVDVRESKQKVEDYITKGGYTFPVLLDEDGAVASTYLVGGLPTSYFVDPEGVLLGGVPGMMTYDQMNQVLDNIRGVE